jgi:hypothetical protein
VQIWDDNGWVNSLYWNFNDEQLHFNNRNDNYANENYAAGVALRPGLL